MLGVELLIAGRLVHQQRRVLPLIGRTLAVRRLRSELWPIDAARFEAGGGIRVGVVRRHSIENGHCMADQWVDVTHVGGQDQCVVGASQFVEGMDVLLGDEERGGAFALLWSVGGILCWKECVLRVISWTNLNLQGLWDNIQTLGSGFCHGQHGGRLSVGVIDLLHALGLCEEEIIQ